MKKIFMFIIMVLFLQNGFAAGPENGPELLPEFHLKATNGEMTSPNDYKGKMIIINFWATWCPPCRKEIPDLIKIQEKNQNVVVLGINLDRESEKVVPFIREQGINFPVLYGNDEIIEKFGGVNFIPQTYIYGEDRKLIQKFNGMVSESGLLKIIDQMASDKKQP